MFPFEPLENPTTTISNAQNDERPRSFEDAIQRIHKHELAARKKQWLKFRDILNDTGLSIPIEEWPVPTGWDSKNVKYIYGHLNEQIRCSHKQILNEDQFLPVVDDWEELLAPVFTFDLGHHAYCPMETYDDGIYETVELQDGSIINISRIEDSSYLTYPPRDFCVAELEGYIRDGAYVSSEIKSVSNRTWRKADSLFRKCRTIITTQLAKQLEELGKLLHEARTDLLLDIEDYDAKQRSIETPAARPQTIGEVPIDEFWSRFNKEKNKAKIGAPSADNHAAKSFTQAKIAEMFGPPCTDEIVANWESKARGSKRGSVPPTAEYKGHLESYREELRKFPIGKNVEILAKIIEQYKTIEGIKAITGKKEEIHCRSDESLYQAQKKHGA